MEDIRRMEEDTRKELDEVSKDRRERHNEFVLMTRTASIIFVLCDR